MIVTQVVRKGTLTRVALRVLKVIAAITVSTRGGQEVEATVHHLQKMTGKIKNIRRKNLK